MLPDSIRHDWPEPAGFLISRPQGHPSVTFLHFQQPVQLKTPHGTVAVRPGGCIFFRPQTPQWFCSDVPLVHNWAHFPDEFLRALEKYQIPTDTLLYPRECGFISDIFRLLELEYFTDNLHREALMAHLTEEFLLRFSRGIRSPDSVPPGDPRDKTRLRAIRHEILSTPEKKWTVGEMARQMHLSASRFHAVYKGHFGTSPMQDLIDARIARAKTLLLARPDAEIALLAEELGYNDQYHFIRQFKARTGLTPGLYRKLTL